MQLTLGKSAYGERTTKNLSRKDISRYKWSVKTQTCMK
jgi:hypothetical protein